MSGQEEGVRVTCFPFSQRKVGNTFGTHGGRCRQCKDNKVIKRMVPGLDISLEETCRMALCGLVGRVSYNYLSKVPISVWVEQHWAPILGYAPEILYLSKGWLGFICKVPKDLTLLLKTRWVFGGSSLMLKWWRVAFDLATKHFQNCHLWVLLPGLPFQL